MESAGSDRLRTYRPGTVPVKGRKKTQKRSERSLQEIPRGLDKPCRAVAAWFRRIRSTRLRKAQSRHKAPESSSQKVLSVSAALQSAQFVHFVLFVCVMALSPPARLDSFLEGIVQVLAV